MVVQLADFADGARVLQLGGRFPLDAEADNIVAAHPHLGKNALVAASQLILRMIQEHEKIQRDTSRTNGPLGAPTITPTRGRRPST